jgi:hypothetical protein
MYDIFYRTRTACLAAGWLTGEGWYWVKGSKWEPESKFTGPFLDEATAHSDAEANCI